MADSFTIAPSKIIRVGDPVDRTPPAGVRIRPAPFGAAGVGVPQDVARLDDAVEPPDPLDPLVQDADITTPWFDPETRPVHQGVYQRRFPAGPYSCWDGARWFGDAANAARAASADTPSAHQDIGWRGLVHASAAPCLSCRGHGVVDFGVDDESGEDLLAPCEDC